MAGALGSAHMCGDAAGKEYPCGRTAALALSDKIGQGNVACATLGGGDGGAAI